MIGSAKSGIIKWRHPWDLDQMASKLPINNSESPITAMPVFDDGTNTPKPTAGGESSSVPPATPIITQTGANAENSIVKEKDKESEEFREFLKYRAFVKTCELQKTLEEEQRKNNQVSKEKNKQRRSPRRTVNLSDTDEFTDESPRRKGKQRKERRDDSPEERDEH